MSVSDRWLVAFFVSWNLQAAWFWIVGLWEMAVLWLVIEATVGSAELWSKLASGLTLTQKFRRRFKSQRGYGFAMLLALAASWGKARSSRIF